MRTEFGVSLGTHASSAHANQGAMIHRGKMRGTIGLTKPEFNRTSQRFSCWGIRVSNSYDFVLLYFSNSQDSKSRHFLCNIAIPVQSNTQVRYDST